jgi:hypothetical protein
VLNYSERIYYSDKVLHYAAQRKTNSTFTLAPIEWLMSLCYAYKNIKREMNLYFKKRKADKYSKRFIRIHLFWMVNRKIDFISISEHPYRDIIIENLQILSTDELVTGVVNKQTGVNREAYKKFLRDIELVIGVNKGDEK